MRDYLHNDSGECCCWTCRINRIVDLREMNAAREMRHASIGKPPISASRLRELGRTAASGALEGWYATDLDRLLTILKLKPISRKKEERIKQIIDALFPEQDT